MSDHRHTRNTAQDSWSATASGLWSDGADWSLGAAPDGSVSATISSTGSLVVTIAAPAVARALLLDGYGVTLVDDASLSVAGGIAIDGATLLLGAGATLATPKITLSGYGALGLGGGTFTTGGTLLVEGGSIGGTGHLVTAGQTEITANQDIYLSNLAVSGVDWTNTGTISDGTDIFFSANTGDTQQIVNAPHGTIALLTAGSGTTAGLEQNFGGGNTQFTNAGLLTAGSGLAFADLSCAIGLATTNTGSIVVENGQTLIFTAALTNNGSIAIGHQSDLLLEGGGPIGGSIGGPGGLTLETGSYAAPAVFSVGSLDVGDVFGEGDPSPATLTVSGTCAIAGGLVVQNSGLLHLAQGVVVSVGGAVQLGSTDDRPFGSLNDAGTIIGAGTLTTAALSFGSAVNDVGGVLGSGLTWQNSGTVDLDSELLLGTSKGGVVHIINEAGATFTDYGGAILPDDGGGGVLTNAGTLASTQSLSSDNGDYLDCRVVNTGLILVGGLTAGETTNGSLVFGQRFVNAPTGTIQIADRGALGLNIGAAIQGSVSGTLGGVYLSTGQYTIATRAFAVGTLSAQGDTLDRSVLHVEGTSQQNGIFLNAAGATFTLSGQAAIVAVGTVDAENDGLLVRSGAAGNSAIDTGLLNTGTIAVQSGTLTVRSLSGGGQDMIGPSATLDILQSVASTQALQFDGSGGTLILAAPQSIASLADFAAGDHLDLQGIGATGASISGTLLTVVSAAGSFTFGSAGLLGDGASLASNAHGDAIVTIVAGRGS